MLVLIQLIMALNIGFKLRFVMLGGKLADRDRRNRLNPLYGYSPHPGLRLVERYRTERHARQVRLSLSVTSA
jgi:hypothetical protein